MIIKKILAYIRFLPIIIFYGIYKNNRRLKEDVDRWLKDDSRSLNEKLIYLMYTFKEFRNLFIYRNRYPKAHRLFCKWIAFWYPPEKTLYIECPDIGGGFYIQHGFATYISARKIGKNFWVNQQVTIGYNGTDGCPTIGDNCMVTCGAKVLGNITLGDCTRVGANAVVIKNYKRGYGVLVGVPATAKNESSKEKLKSLGIDFDEALFD